MLRTDRQAVPSDGLDLTLLVASCALTPQIVQGDGRPEPFSTIVIASSHGGSFRTRIVELIWLGIHRAK